MSRAVLVCLAMSMLALVGCSTLADLSDLRADLTAAGYDTTDLNHNTMNGHDVLTIQVVDDIVPGEEHANEIAEIVWTTYPSEVDQLVILLNGQQFMDATAGELTERFGERPARPAGQAEDSGGSGTMVIVIAVVVAVLLAGLVVLVWWRGRRPPPPVAPPAPQPQYPYHHPPQPPL